MYSEKNNIIKAARLIAVLCVALIFSGCLADSAANSGSCAVSISETAQTQSESSSPETVSPNLDELEAFLTDSGVIYWLEARPLDSIIAGAPVLAPELRMMVSQCLRAAAGENGLEMKTNDEGVPFFAIEDFVRAAKELTGLGYNFEDIAKITSDMAPDGMLCVTWGYDMPINKVTIDKDSLTKTELGYTVELENQYSSPGEGFLPGEKFLLAFSQNTDYIACPFRIIALTNMIQSDAEISDTLLGDAQVSSSDGVPVYEQANINSAILTTIPDGPMVPFYFNDGTWAYIEYDGVKGWSESKFFVFPPDPNAFITLEEAQRIALSLTDIKDVSTVKFTEGSIEEQLGNMFTWNIEYTTPDGERHQCLINAIDGSIFAY